MTYKWVVPTFSVPAQTAGEELERIGAEAGEITPQTVLDASRPETAVLHNCFEWDDSVAAEKYRLDQSGRIIRNITVIKETPQKEEVQVRAFVKTTERAFEPIEIVLSEKSKREVLLETALMELRAFERKYNILSELAEVFAAIDKLSA